MGLRGLFRRSTETALPAPVPPGAGSPEAIDPLTAEQAAELQAAWDELARAVEGSGVDSFNACTRTGRSWAEDPASVRAIAALLRDDRTDEAPPVGGPQI
jgi:hypothetical protein